MIGLTENPRFIWEPEDVQGPPHMFYFKRNHNSDVEHWLVLSVLFCECLCAQEFEKPEKVIVKVAQ